MGIEYRLTFTGIPDELDRDLRSMQFFSHFDPQYGLYNYRCEPAVRSGIPTAWVRIEPDGLYLCDNGGSSAHSAMIFRSVIDVALKQSASVAIEQL
jgi:hypothetical protein